MGKTYRKTVRDWAEIFGMPYNTALVKRRAAGVGMVMEGTPGRGRKWYLSRAEWDILAATPAPAGKRKAGA